MKYFDRQGIHLKPNITQSILLPNGIDENFMFLFRYNHLDWNKTIDIKLKSGNHTRLSAQYTLQYGQKEGCFQLPMDYKDDVLFYRVDELLFISKDEVILDIIPLATEVVS